MVGRRDVWKDVDPASRLLMGHISDEARFDRFDGPFSIRSFHHVMGHEEIYPFFSCARRSPYDLQIPSLGRCGVGRLPSRGEDLCQSIQHFLTHNSSQGQRPYGYVDRQYELSVALIVFFGVRHVGRIHVPLIIHKRSHDASPFKLGTRFSINGVVLLF